MAGAEAQVRLASSEVFRWGACAALVLIAHGLVLLVISKVSDAVDLEAGSSVIAIELAPLAVAPPAPPNDLAPGPDQPQIENRETEREEREPERPQEIVKPVPESPAPDPAAVIPTPEPIKPPAEDKPEPQTPTQVATAPPAAAVPDARAAAPDPGRVPQPSPAAVATWQHQLVARIERYKRYPSQAKGERGVAGLAFRLDRHGNIISSRIIHSSGSAILDAEALATIKRAEPFPAPPADIPDNGLSFILPIRYAAAAQR
jgi:periplasmic protein TonB